ncbi:hypothetical protein [Aerosakkonema funiforme]|uniref:hypothetical protein n=1 Tax=Aerosakkonema funiforme TaxID=1246630 RepID=UPI0035B6E2DA
MKQLPDKKKLLELLELAKDFEREAREMSEFSTEIAYKWQCPLEARRSAKQEVSQVK